MARSDIDPQGFEGRVRAADPPDPRRLTSGVPGVVAGPSGGRRGFRNRRQAAEKRKPGWGSSFGGSGDSLTIDNHGKLRFMAKKRISSTDLIWIFHQKLQAFDDFPLHGIAIAIVPTENKGWKALTSQYYRKHGPRWAARVAAIEKKLRNNYVLKG
jgi:hypothetical protein